MDNYNQRNFNFYNLFAQMIGNTDENLEDFLERNFQRDIQLGQNDPNAYLLRMLLDLSQEHSDLQAMRISHFLAYFNGGIDPLYIDDNYIHQVGYDYANFFYVIYNLTNTPVNIKDSLLDQLFFILEQKILDTEYDQDNIPLIAEIICTYRDADENSNTLINIITDGAYSISELSQLYSSNPQHLRIAFFDSTIKAIKSGLNLECIMKLSNHYLEHGEIYTLNSFLSSVLSDSNLDHVKANSLQKLLQEVVVQDWKNITHGKPFDVINKLTKQDYFKMLISNNVMEVVQKQFVPLTFIMNLDKNELAGFISKDSLSAVCQLFNKIIDKRINNYQAKVCDVFDSNDQENKPKVVMNLSKLIRKNQIIKYCINHSILL